MAIYDEQGLLQRLIQKIKSSGIGGLTRAIDVREFLTDVVNTMFSLFSSTGTAINQELKWDAAIVYDTVTKPYAIYDLRIYQSKIDNNINHTPPIEADGNGRYEDAYWKEVSAAPKSAIQEYQPDKLYLDPDLTILHYNGQLIRLDAIRPFLSENIEQEITDGEWTVISGGSGPSHFLGKYTTLAALQTAIPTASDGDYAIIDPGAGTPAVEYIWDAEEGWVAGGEAVDISGKADKITGGTSGNLVERDVNGNIVDSGVKKEQFVNLSQIDTSDILEGETKLLVAKKEVGTGQTVFEGGTNLMDKLVPAASFNTLLADTASWSGDTLTLTGDNLNGELGQNGQEHQMNSQFYICISHDLGTTTSNGSAVWVRNRSKDSLDPNLASDAAVITELELETGWNAIENSKIITVRSKVGSWYSKNDGYVYFCYDNIGENWYWRRIGQPNADFIQISNATLIAEIESHDFTTTPILLPVSSVKGNDRQEHYWEVTGTPHLSKCIDDSGIKKWIKLL